MVTISEARQQVVTAKETIQKRKQEASQAEKRLQQARTSIPEVTQKSLREIDGGLAGRLRRRQIEGFKTEISTREQAVRRFRGELTKSEKEIVEFEKEIKQAEVRQEQSRVAQERAEQLFKAKEMLLDIRSAAGFKEIPRDIREQARREVKDIKEGLSVRAFFEGVEQVKRELLPAEKIVGIDLKKSLITIESPSQVIPKQVAPTITEPSPFFTPLPKKTFFEKLGVPKPVREFFSGESFERARAETAIRSQGQRFVLGKGFVGRPTFREGTPEFEEAVLKQIQSQKTGTFVQSAFLLSFAGVKVPIPKRIPIRQIRTPSFIEVQQPVITPFGKPTTISSFQITREISPPRFVPSKTGGFLEGTIRPAKLEITKTPFKVLGDQPFVTLTTRGGAIGRVDIIAGTSKPTSLADLRKLPRTQQLLWQRLAESVAGRPVSLKNVPKILKQESQKVSGILKQFRLGKIEVGKPTKAELLEEKTLGKRTSIFETAAEFRKVKETEKFEFFKGSIFFKDVSKPFPRATGKTPELKGTILRVKEPIVLGKQKDVEFIKPADIKKTPLSKTFQEQEQVQTQLKIPRVPPPKPAKPRTTLKVKEPTKVSGIGVLLSGVSDRIVIRESFGNIVSNINLGFTQAVFGKGVQKPFAKAAQKIGIQQFQTPAQIISPKKITRQVQIVQPVQKVRIKQAQVPKAKQVIKQVPRPIQALRNLLKIAQKAPVKLIRPIPPRTIPRPPPPIITRVEKTIISRNGVKIKKINGKFVVFVREFGVDVEKGTFDTLTEANNFLEAILETTIRASGIILKDKKKIKPPRLAFGFRPSKVDPFRLVEKRRRRLSTRSEVSEILSLKKTKRRKNIFGF